MSRKTICCLAVLLLSASAAFGLPEKYSRGNFVPADRMLKAGEVRAEIIGDSSQFLGGPKREARVGDFKMLNSNTGFVIAGTRMQSGIFMYGGVVEEAGILRAENGGGRWYNLLGDTGFILYKGADPIMGGRLLAPVSAEIISDGSDGKAVVRITARDAEWPEKKEVISKAGAPLKLKAVIDYILTPDSSVLEIKITLVNYKDKTQVISVGQLFLTGDGSSLFAPGHGFDITAADGKEFPIFTSIGGGVSYGWFSGEGDMRVDKNMSRRQITTFGKLKLPPGEKVSMSMYLAVGGGGSSSVSEIMHKLKKQTGYGTVQGKCATKEGDAAADAVVHALSPEGAIAANSDVADDGSFSLALPPGKYSLQAAAYDRPTPAPVNVEVTAGEISEAIIEMDYPATLAYNISDESNNSIPAVVAFKRISPDPAELPADFYYNRTGGYGAGFFKIHFAGPVPGSVNVRPGDYEVYISHGLEYEYEMKSVSLTGGATENISASLARVVDTTGFLSADFHIHSQPSNDTNDLISIKMSAAAALGLEIPVATDHDVITDYAPYIEELGLGGYLKSIAGDEVTTIWLGHFNAYPLTFDPAKKNYGAPLWFGLSAPEILNALRDDPQDNTIVQVNHPRSANGGYFNIISYDPETGTAGKPEQFSLNFDGMEVLNGASYDETVETLPDWYSFLNRGKPVIGLGNSDNHSTYNLGLGYPRNYVPSPTDAPSEMLEDDFISSVRAQEVSVCGGAFITVNMNGVAGPGQIVTDTDGKVELNIKVQAPSWMETKTLVVVRGGETVRTVDISAVRSVARFEGSITVEAESDTWFVVRVEGEKNLFPVYPGARAFSFTNPVYVDSDGNGVYDPPIKY